MHVLAIGNNTIDHVFMTPHGATPGSKTIATSLRCYAGGQAANVAADLAGLGLFVHYLGAYGDDQAGTISKRSLARLGVRLDGCRSVRGCPSHQATVVVDAASGGRTIVMYKDVRLTLDHSAVDPAWLEGIGLVYLDGHEPGASLAAARLAKERGIPALADAECVHEGLRELLPYLSSLIAPMDVIAEVAGDADPRAAVLKVHEKGPNTVIATAGASGAVGANRDAGLLHVPALECPVVDTTGAGDAFHAGYIAGIFAGLPFGDAMQFATHVAAAKCGEPGPRVRLSRLRNLRQVLLGGLEWRNPIRGQGI